MKVTANGMIPSILHFVSSYIRLHTARSEDIYCIHWNTSMNTKKSKRTQYKKSYLLKAAEMCLMTSSHRLNQLIGQRQAWIFYSPVWNCSVCAIFGHSMLKEIAFSTSFQELYLYRYCTPFNITPRPHIFKIDSFIQLYLWNTVVTDKWTYLCMGYEMKIFANHIFKNESWIENALEMLPRWHTAWIWLQFRKRTNWLTLAYYWWICPYNQVTRWLQMERLQTIRISRIFINKMQMRSAIRNRF